MLRPVQGTKWIVTGGAGFIGANTVRALAARGAESVIVDNLSRPTAPLNVEWLEREVPDSFTLVREDVRDRDALARVFAQHGDASVVLHLAGQVAVTT